MDQGVIATFKAYYLHRAFRQWVERLDDIIGLDKDRKLSIKGIWKNFHILKTVEIIEASWQEVTSGTVNKAGRKIWPKAIESPSGIDIDSDAEINREILEIAKTIGFDEIDEEDIFGVINTLEVPLSNEELLNIVTDDTKLVQQNLDKGGKEFPTRKIPKFLDHSEKALEYLEDERDNERRQTVSLSISKSVECYRELYKSRKLEASQTTLSKFLKPSTSGTASQLQTSAGIHRDLSSIISLMGGS
ncbi:tigger transposable element-derived protein 1-like [Hermetia illucens]|uniref:tigger transposable element-derived protein 1-like n=1 Tax=Hermetia illucens TaxID=343691 RepID=UPI0018CC2A96|nr:tigger transposable element-derived protein 1-like [Hermetia illucens]